jgi:outer membrane protein
MKSRKIKRRAFMKKVILFVGVALILVVNTAFADSIAGKFGVTARGGVSYIFNSEWTDAGMNELLSGGVVVDKSMKAGIGWAAGGGLMYGITDNLAVDFDVIYAQSDIKFSSGGIDYTLGTGYTSDVSIGAQWRFMPKSKFVPYVGAGLDILVNGISLKNGGGNVDVATSYGAHLSGGADFFITPKIALNAEIRGMYGTEGDIKEPNGIISAKYNPTNISGFVGVRFFFP